MDLSKLISQEQQAAPQQPTYTKEEYAAQKQAEREALWQHVDELTAGIFTDGASLQGFLDFTAHCNRQRTANLLLLYDQEPTITMARSFDAWQQAGRPVRAGETGYTALVGQDYEREDGKTGHGYRIGKMFDVTQTRGRPLPESRHYEAEELIAALVETSPVALRLSDQLPDQVQAQYVPAQRTIFVRNGMEAAVTYCLLTRELAHSEFARIPGYRRRDFAAQAYCAAYVLAQKYGVAAPNFQFDHIVAEYTGREPRTQRQFLSDVKIAAYTVSRQMDRGLREDLEHDMANALNTWNDKLGEIWQLLTVSPVSYNGGTVWNVMTGIYGALQAIGYGLLVLFFAAGVVKTCGSFVEVKKPEHALKLFVRFALAKAAVDYGLDLMLAVFDIVQGMVSRVIGASGASGIGTTTLPQELIDTINGCGFWESIPLWAVTLIGSLLITVLSFVMVLTVYGRMFSLWMYAAIAPVPLSSFAGDPSASVGKNFLRSYAGVCLQGLVIALACIIFSALSTSAPTVDAGSSAITAVWSYVGTLAFNLLVLVGAVKGCDRIVKEIMGL